MLGRDLILASNELDYVEGSIGYRSLSSEFIRDVALRAHDQRLAYLVVHNHLDDSHAGFSHVERASRQRGYPALRAIARQPIGALVLTRDTAVGELWLPDGSRHALTELLVPTNPLTRRCPDPPPTHGPAVSCGASSMASHASTGR